MLSTTWLNRIICLCLAALCGLTAARAQDATPAVTVKSASAPPVSYSTLRGTVFSADNRQPARRVAVLLILTVDPDKSKEGGYYDDTTTRRTVTDAQGNYSFSDIPPGRYALYATVPGAVSPLMNAALEAAEADAKLTDETAPPVEVAAHYVTFDGHNYLNADLTLASAGRVAGRVTYPDGEPVVKKTVMLWRKTAQGLVSLAFLKAFTDDRGTYLIEDVPAGEYIAGVLDDFGTKQLNRQTSESSFAAAYHPDTLRLTKAVPFTVSAGATADNVNITVPTEGLGRLSGLVTWRIDGQPAQAEIAVRRVPDKEEAGNDGFLRYRTYQKLSETFQGQEANPFVLFEGAERILTTTDERGRWELANLPAGKYLLRVTGRTSSARFNGQSPKTSGSQQRQATGLVVTEVAEFGGESSQPSEGIYQVQHSQIVTLSDMESAEVTTQLTQGATVSGIVRQTDGTPLRGSRHFWLNPVRLTNETDELDSNPSYFQTNEGGTFTARGLRTGVYQFELFGDKDYLASVSLKGRTLPGQLLEVGADATIDGVQIILGQDKGTLAGRVVSADGTPLAGVRVVALQPDWQTQNNDSPAQDSTISRRDGTFTLLLPPGRWLISTTPRNFDNRTSLDEFWRQVMARAQTVTLAPKATQTLTLTVPRAAP